MILRWLRFLVWVLFLAWVVWVVRRLGRLAHGPTGQRRTGGRPVGRALDRDPVCGGYVAPEAGVDLRIGGRSVRFCSTGCRDRYVEQTHTGERPPG